MSHTRLRRLVGMALVDRELCDGLMNGKRSALLAEFDLTDEEREVLSANEIESARELASTVHSWLKERADPATAQVACNVIQAF